MKRLLILYTTFSSIMSFAGLFINIYVWKNNQSLVDVGIYNLTYFLFIFLGTMLGMYYLKRLNSSINFIFATIFLALTFAAIYLVKDIEWLIPFIGAPLGLSLGLFYIGFNIYVLIVPNPNTRTYLLSMEEVLGRISSFVIPFISALMISYLGYPFVFALIFLMVLGVSVISFNTPKYTSNFTFKSTSLSPLWKKYKFIFLSLIAFGFLNGLVGIASSVLMFSRIADEFFLGTFNTILSLVGITSSFILSKKLLGNKTHINYLKYGAMLSFVAIFLLLFNHTPLLIAFNLLIAFSIPLLWIPVNIAQFNEMKKFSCTDEFTCDLNLLSSSLIIRELFLTIGRILFFSILLINQLEIHWVFIFIVMLSLLIPLCIYYGNRQLIE